VQTLIGATITVGSSGTKTTSEKCQLIFFLSPSCPVCKRLLPVLQSIQQREFAWLSIVLVSDGGEVASHQAFVQQHNLEAFPYVVSETLGVTYGISRLPYGVLIDERGIVSAFGLVNSREQVESLFEAKRLNKPNIQEFLLESQVRSELAAEQVSS
jgi:methylamine dehydrogenase accessory protein MauD